MTETETLSLDEIRERLADAQSNFEMAKFIDSTARMQRERKRYADEIRYWQGLIRAREAGQ